MMKEDYFELLYKGFTAELKKLVFVPEEKDSELEDMAIDYLHRAYIYGKDVDWFRDQDRKLTGRWSAELQDTPNFGGTDDD